MTINMKSVKIGDKAVAFSNFGLVKGIVVKTTLYKPLGVRQYKLEVNGKLHNFWYTAEELYPNKFVALVALLVKSPKK